MAGLFLTAWGMAVFWLAGNKRRSAWAMGMAGQVWWSLFALHIGEPGLLVGCAFYFAVYARNWRKWAPECS